LTDAMSLTAALRGLQGGTGRAEIRTMGDVDQFIGSLAEPDVDDASLTHTGRPLVVVPMMGDDPVLDHVVHVAVRDGWGYLIYAGASARHADGFTGHPEGDPRSPGTFGSYDEYPSGSGLPLPRLAEVLIGFLEAGDLPTGVARVSQDDQV
jgi:immunity protein Imm1 of predicted polymorphic toxin system